MRLPYKELLQLKDKAGELLVNQTVYVEHCKTGYGNNKCGVTRKEDATLIHCFHCGGRGVIKDKYANVNRKLSTKPQESVSKTFHRPPQDATENPSQWSVGALQWIGRAGLTLAECQQFHMQYSTEAGRVFIPLLKEGDIVGWLGRKIEAEGQKYLLSKKDDFIFNIDNGGDTCIIVEDCLSAIRIGRNYDVVALMGTALNDYVLNKLINRYKSYIIWLDNDNPIVKMKQVKAKNTLSTFGTTSMLKTANDPKEYTDLELKKLITGERSERI